MEYFSVIHVSMVASVNSSMVSKFVTSPKWINDSRRSVSIDVLMEIGVMIIPEKKDQHLQGDTSHALE